MRESSDACVDVYLDAIPSCCQMGGHDHISLKDDVIDDMLYAFYVVCGNEKDYKGYYGAEMSMCWWTRDL